MVGGSGPEVAVEPLPQSLWTVFFFCLLQGRVLRHCANIVPIKNLTSIVPKTWKYDGDTIDKLQSFVYLVWSRC